QALQGLIVARPPRPGARLGAGAWRRASAAPPAAAQRGEPPLTGARGQVAEAWRGRGANGGEACKGHKNGLEWCAGGREMLPSPSDLPLGQMTRASSASNPSKEGTPMSPPSPPWVPRGWVLLGVLVLALMALVAGALRQAQRAAPARHGPVVLRFAHNQ